MCFEKGKEIQIIKPHQTAMLPTGIATAMHKTKVLLFRERGSVGSKGIALRCGVVDSNYRGEIFIALQNNTDKDLWLVHGDKKADDTKGYMYLNIDKAIAQGIVVDIPIMNEQEISFEELKEIESDRGDGKLGSSEK